MSDRKYEIRHFIREETQVAFDAIEKRYKQDLETLKPNEPGLNAEQRKHIKKALQLKDELTAVIAKTKTIDLSYKGNLVPDITEASFVIAKPDTKWKETAEKKKFELSEAVKFEYKKAEIILLAGSRKDVFNLLNTYGERVLALAEDRKKLTAGSAAGPAVVPAPNENVDIEIEVQPKPRRSRSTKRAGS